MSSAILRERRPVQTIFWWNSAKSIGLCMSFACIGKLAWFEFPLLCISIILYGRGWWLFYNKYKNTICTTTFLCSFISLPRKLPSYFSVVLLCPPSPAARQLLRPASLLLQFRREPVLLLLQFYLTGALTNTTTITILMGAFTTTITILSDGSLY